MSGFATLLERRCVAVASEDWTILAAMWNAQRHAMNERVNAKLDALKK